MLHGVCNIKGPSIKYVTIFLPIFTPFPVTLYHTSQNPLKYVMHPGPPKVRHTLEVENPNDCPTLIYTPELCNVRSIKITVVLYCNFF